MPNKETPAADEPRSYRYRDCLDGTAPIPKDALGNAIFSLLMAGGMTTFMVSFNGVRHSGLSFFFESLWLYPVIFCLAMASCTSTVRWPTWARASCSRASPGHAATWP